MRTPADPAGARLRPQKEGSEHDQSSASHGKPRLRSRAVPQGKAAGPIQPLESAAALAIVIWIVLRSRRLNYKTECTSFPLMLLAFGLTRFFQEFARDNEKVFLGCSVLSFHALLAAVVGAVWLIVLRRRKKEAVSPSL